MKITTSIITASLLSSALFAAPISNEDGFSGFVAAGVTSMKYESNMYAGTYFDDEMTDDKIDNIDSSPDKESSTQGSFNFNVKYTFAESQTEVYIGTLLEDVLTFDSTAIFGVRKHFDDVGILSVALLGSSLPTKTWEDPYKTSGSRKDVDMTSRGASLKWEGIMESNFDVEFRFRTYDIDGGDESGKSGPYLRDDGSFITLTSSEADELDREGDLRQVIGAYRWKIDDRNYLRTAIRVSDYDLDGEAMQRKRYGLKLDYLYVGDRWGFVGVLGVAKDRFDNDNPLYGKKADADNLGGALTVTYKNPFNLVNDQFYATTTVGAYDYDSDIDFYDARAVMVNVGVLYKF
jgi:hypothetical protein